MSTPQAAPAEKSGGAGRNSGENPMLLFGQVSAIICKNERGGITMAGRMTRTKGRELSVSIFC